MYSLKNQRALQTFGTQTPKSVSALQFYAFQVSSVLLKLRPLTSQNIYIQFGAIEGWTPTQIVSPPTTHTHNTHTHKHTRTHTHTHTQTHTHTHTHTASALSLPPSLTTHTHTHTHTNWPAPGSIANILTTCYAPGVLYNRTHTSQSCRSERGQASADSPGADYTTAALFFTLVLFESSDLSSDPHKTISLNLQ